METFGFSRELARAYISITFDGIDTKVSDEVSDKVDINNDILTVLSNDLKVEVRYCQKANMIIVSKKEKINNLEHDFYFEWEEKPERDITKRTICCFYSLANTDDGLCLCREIGEIESREQYYENGFFGLDHSRPCILNEKTEYHKVPSTFKITDLNSVEALNIPKIDTPVGTKRYIKKDKK